ncbi:MAG: NlpC/P60 family protein [Clostridium sp.]|nr:NlpC/P60 family protein [Clostridium sp.]
MKRKTLIAIILTVAMTTNITVSAATIKETSTATAKETSTTTTIGETSTADEVVESVKGESRIETPKITYSTHVQNIGWQDAVTSNGIGGTTGKSLRLEAYKLNLKSSEDLSIEYRSHVQNVGWQDWKSNGELSGTEGESKRLEAISIRLTGKDASKYDIYYRVHCSYIGWLGWAKNGEDAGSTGQGIKVEAMQVVILPKGQKAPGSTENHFLSTPSVTYTVKFHNGNFGNNVKDGAMAGTTGQSKQLDGIKINLNNSSLMSGSINYQGHIQGIGWGDTVSDGTFLGVNGNRLEGIRIWLTGAMDVYYDVYYRVHCQSLGWLDWAKNGESAGSEGYGYRAEAIEIKLVRKGLGPDTDETASFKKAKKVNPQLKNICHLDSPTIDYNYYSDSITLRGWALSGYRVNGIHVYLDDKFYKAIPVDGYRPDVSNAYPAYEDDYSGFSVTIPMNGLETGQHQVRLYIIDGNNKTFCPTITSDEDRHQKDSISFYNNNLNISASNYFFNGMASWRKTVLNHAFGMRGIAYYLGGNFYDPGTHISYSNGMYYFTPVSQLPKTGAVPGYGLDCAGFTQRCYRMAGIYIGRTTWDQCTYLCKTSLPKAGDLYFKKDLDHVGIYLKDNGDGTFTYIDCNQTWEGAMPENHVRGRVEVRREKKVKDCVFYTPFN